ncbi:MAG: serine/threonine-protein kinase [Anaerolineales bacterium]|nr:serine/threonine-protein kinase [Anaerolineales bacterium]
MPPSTISRYEIRTELGRGGMATVYRAFDPRFEREVAIKLLPADLQLDEGLRARFEREAKTIAMIEHPAIVPVYDYGEENGQLYLVMRLMTGGSLADRLRRRGALHINEVLRIIEQVAGGLDAAHAKGIVHRDLKPGNILFDEYGNAMISDFGIVKLTQASVALTQTSSLVGTPAYMSPEQIRGEADIDRRSDLYSLGVIIFEMLSGQLPYAADTPYGVMMKHVSEPVPRILDTQPHLAPDCQAVIERAMAKRREARFSTAGELAFTLARAFKHQAPAEPPPPVQPAPKPTLMTRSSPAFREQAAATPAAPQPAPPQHVAPAHAPAAPPAAQRRRPAWLLPVIGLGVVSLGLAALAVGALAFSLLSTNIAATPSAPTQAATLVQPTAVVAAATFTSTPMPTPAATDTPAPATTPTLPPPVIEPVSIAPIANSPLSVDYAKPPEGRVELGGVTFDLDGRAFRSQASPSPNNTFPAGAVLEVSLPRVERVFVLITAGNAFLRFRDKTVARIVLTFDAVPAYSVDLVLGKNLREWHRPNNVVNTAPDITEVWRGPIKGYPNLVGHLDMLTITLPEEWRAATLTRIEFVDLSEITVGSLDPAITVAGVSVEHR